jgi:hypothetical protein
MRQSTPTDSTFTEQELIKLNTRFGHPGTKRLFEFYVASLSGRRRKHH